MNRLNRILAAVLVLLIVLVWVFESPMQKSGYERTESKSAPLFPGFDESRAAKIEIKKGDGEQVLVKKDASGAWVVDSLFAYKANEGKVLGLLKSVRAMNNHDIVDADPSDLEKPYNLGPKNGVEVKIADASGVAMVAFVQGKLEGDFKDPDFQRRMRKMPSYVRRLEGKEIYLVPEFLPVSATSKDWVETSLGRFDSGKVNEIHLAGALCGGEISLKKEGEEWNLLAPESAKAKKEVVDGMARSMSSAFFRELVGTIDDPAKYELNSPQLKVSMKLEGGEEHVFWIGKQLEDKSYFASKGEKDKFVYQLNSYTVDALKKTLADLKDVPPPPPAPPAEAPASEEPAKPQ